MIYCLRNWAHFAVVSHCCHNHLQTSCPKIQCILMSLAYGNIRGIKGVFSRKIGFNKWILRQTKGYLSDSSNWISKTHCSVTTKNTKCFCNILKNSKISSIKIVVKKTLWNAILYTRLGDGSGGGGRVNVERCQWNTGNFSLKNKSFGTCTP